MRKGFIVLGLAAMIAAGPAAAQDIHLLAQRCQVDAEGNPQPGTDRGQAIEACTALIQMGRWTGPGLAAIYGNRALSYLGTGRNDEAIADLDAAKYLDPNNAVIDDWRKQAVAKRDATRASHDAAAAPAVARDAQPRNDACRTYDTRGRLLVPKDAGKDATTVIDACTKVIDAGQESGRRLADAHASRAKAGKK